MIISNLTNRQFFLLGSGLESPQIIQSWSWTGIGCDPFVSAYIRVEAVAL
jgi:hypothetical protein